MSKLGKLLLWAALLGALVAVGAGIALILQYDTTKTNLQNTQTARDTALKDAATQKAAAEASAQAKAESDAKLATATSQITDLNTQLATAQKAATDAQGALSTANDATKAAQDKLDKITATLAGNDPAQLIADTAKAKQDLETSQSEQKILQDQVQAALAQVDQLKKDINASKVSFIPPGVSGKVTFVNRTWNFVVLDVGLSNNVVPNGELIVYRGKSFLGKVKVTSAEANSCVADILPDAKGDIQVGDYVLN